MKTKLGTSGFCATLQMQNVENGHGRLFLVLAFEMALFLAGLFRVRLRCSQ
ncbi:MAG: hypothetical protein PUF27_03690 [Bacteroidales bacterium]|nr:hypothetical protein [Bacteroidales bacterium]MDD6537535.1 hypothetical protein [Bacteroidales bacterium]MDD6554712.1 hypothetical protein [Bacteroidales bacterium]